MDMVKSGYVIVSLLYVHLYIQMVGKIAMGGRDALIQNINSSRNVYYLWLISILSATIT